METLNNFVRTLGPVRLAVIGSVMFALAGFFVWIFAQASAPRMSLLYGDLEMAEAAKIVAQLEATGIPYELGSGGAAVFVPADRVARTRVAMAEQGLPAGGSLGYEIFDHADVLGSTTFQQNVNLVRALEGELSRTIRAIDQVKAARVHLVLAKRETFSREKPEASASVMLQMRGRSRLSPAQVAAVQQLVASAVPSLSPGRISIIDAEGTLLSEEQGTDEVTAAAAKTDQRRRQVETHLGRTVEQLLERIVGPGKVRAEVAAEMDFDRVNTSEEIFDPDGQVVRSTQSVQQSGSSRDGAGESPVSVATNLPDAQVDQAGAANGASSSENRSEETVNYEISKKVVNHVREAGIIKRMSIAVLVDGVHGTAADGTRTYQPRDAKELEQLTALVRNATGFDASRGDTVEVLSMLFAEPEQPVEEQTALFLGLEKADLMRIGQYMALFILALLVLLLVVKPIVSKAIDAAPAARAGGGGPRQDLLPGTSPTVALPGPDGGTAGMLPHPAGEGNLEDMINVDRVEGRVKASSLKRVGAIVEKHPEESLAIVRNWLHSED